jgi:hypothetical protein
MKTTIKSITSKEFTKDGKTNISHTVELDNGVTGYLNDKGSSQGLKQGDTVDYTLEVKKNKKGTDYNLLSINLLPPSAMTGSAPSTPEFKQPSVNKVQKAGSIEEMKFEGRKVCMKLAVSCFIAGKFETIAQVKEHFLDWVEAMDASIDDIKTA